LLSCRALKLCTIREEYILRVSENKVLIKEGGIRWVGLTTIYRCPRMNVKYFGKVFLMLNYTDITQNTYIQS